MSVVVKQTVAVVFNKSRRFRFAGAGHVTEIRVRNVPAAFCLVVDNIRCTQVYSDKNGVLRLRDVFEKTEMLRAIRDTAATITSDLVTVQQKMESLYCSGIVDIDLEFDRSITTPIVCEYDAYFGVMDRAHNASMERQTRSLTLAKYTEVPFLPVGHVTEIRVTAPIVDFNIVMNNTSTSIGSTKGVLRMKDVFEQRPSLTCLRAAACGRDTRLLTTTQRDESMCFERIDYVAFLFTTTIEDDVEVAYEYDTFIAVGGRQ